jgi:hypothetical protein
MIAESEKDTSRSELGHSAGMRRLEPVSEDWSFPTSLTLDVGGVAYIAELVSPSGAQRRAGGSGAWNQMATARSCSRDYARRSTA